MTIPSEIWVREATRADREAVVAANAANVTFHAPFAAPFTTCVGFDTWFDGIGDGRRVGFLVWDGQTLAGVVNLNEIVRGIFLSAYLGYYGYAGAARRGVMTEGVRLVVGAAFGRLGLHRLEANIQPENARSKALVQRLGFRLEGYSPEYLFIDGAWRDHERWAILNPALQRP